MTLKVRISYFLPDCRSIKYFGIGNRSWSLCFIVSFISRTLAHLKFFTMHLLCILALQSFWIMHIQIYVRYDWYFSYCSCNLVVAKHFFSNLIMHLMLYNSCMKGRFSLKTSQNFHIEIICKFSTKKYFTVSRLRKRYIEKSISTYFQIRNLNNITILIMSNNADNSWPITYKQI